MADTHADSRAQLLDLTDPTTGGALAGGGRGGGRLFRMDNFIDTTNIEGRFEFSEFVRAYGKYLDEQLAVVAQCGWYQVRALAAHKSMENVILLSVKRCSQRRLSFSCNSARCFY